MKPFNDLPLWELLAGAVLFFLTSPLVLFNVIDPLSPKLLLLYVISAILMSAILMFPGARRDFNR